MNEELTRDSLTEMGAHAHTASAGELSLQAADKFLADRFRGAHLRIYEAGGGSASCLSAWLLKNAQVTVVDLDEFQLEKNSFAHKKIHGDIQFHEFPNESFELIVCYNVIEHLQFPDRAIRLFLNA